MQKYDRPYSVKARDERQTKVKVVQVDSVAHVERSCTYVPGIVFTNMHWYQLAARLMLEDIATKSGFFTHIVLWFRTLVSLQETVMHTLCCSQLHASSSFLQSRSISEFFWKNSTSITAQSNFTDQMAQFWEERINGLGETINCILPIIELKVFISSNFQTIYRRKPPKSVVKRGQLTHLPFFHLPFASVRTSDLP